MTSRNDEPWLSAVKNDPRSEAQMRADYFRKIADLKEPAKNSADTSTAMMQADRE